MSSRMRPDLTALVALALIASSVAHAAVQCPSTLGGHPLRPSGGGTLYEGPVRDNAALAPDNTRQGPGGWVNTWRFTAAPDVTLVCRYQGIQASEQVPLTRDIRTCRQDVRSFVCQ